MKTWDDGPTIKSMMTGNEGAANPPELLLEYDTRDWPRGRAFEFDREALRATYDLRRPMGTDRHWFRSQIRLVGSLMLARNDGDGGHILVRNPEHIESNPALYLKLQLFFKPGGSLASGDRIVALDPGAVFLIDQSRPYRQTMPAGQNLTFFLPHARVHYDPATMPAVLRFGSESLECRFLSHAMRMAFRLSVGAPASDRSGLAHALCGSVSGLLDWRVSRSERQAASPTVRIEAARRLIDLNLSDPEFGPEDILANVAASRATLYRDFSPMGGLMAYILSRRLEMAYHILSMSPRGRGAVSGAAESAGFVSLSQFSRAFRNRYGSAPSDILGQWRVEGQNGPPSGENLPVARLDALRALYTWPSATTAFGHLSSRTGVLL